jgi:virulence-associated protein VagC
MRKKVIETVAQIEDAVNTKLFMNGGSQAVRIPAKWRFDSEEVELSWDEGSQTLLIRAISKEELKAAFIAQVKALTPAERKQIREDFTFSRDLTHWTPNPKFADLFGSEK